MRAASDSLMQILNKRIPDSTRVNVLNQLAREYVNDKPDTSIRIAFSAKELAKSIGLTEVLHWQIKM
jgi:hypothetical protein